MVQRNKETFFFSPDILATTKSASSAPKITTSELHIATLVLLGLASRDVEFNRAWTFDQVEGKLREILPILFAYFDSLDPREDGLPHWILVCRDGRKTAIYPVLKPDGQNLFDIKSRSGRPIKEPFIIIGMQLVAVYVHQRTNRILAPRERIPDWKLSPFRESFNTKPVLDLSPDVANKRKLEELGVEVDEDADYISPNMKISESISRL